MKKVRAAMRPTITLTPDDIRELRTLSDDLEREVMRSYEEFAVRSQRRVDPQRWKHIKSQEDLHVYRERSSYKQSTDPRLVRASGDEIAFEIGPQAALAANSKMPVLLATGTMPGHINDAMYGTTFFDTRSLRARNSYSKETMEENAVVGFVEGPTTEDPFRFLGVVWYYKTFPIPGIMSNRDMLMVASSHFSELRCGERVGLMLFHSIQHRDAPDRRDLSILRADVSVAALYRQLDELRVEVYISSFVDAKSSSPESLLYLDSARSLLTVNNMCDVALRRKLFYRMREVQRERNRSQSSVIEPQTHDDSECALCSKSFTGVFSPSGSTCQICSKRVCNKCSMTKHIVIDSHRTAYTAMPFDFCLVCTLDTKELPSLTVAKDEVYERSLAPRDPLASSPSSSSCSSV